MTITSVSSSTFLADSIILIRDKLRTNISSVSSRVYTSYPKTNVIYPIITVVDRGISQPQRLGMGSEATAINIDIEIRVWARNIKQRDELFDEIYDYLRTNQLDATTGLVASNLSGFQLLSAVNIDDTGIEGVKSKVMEVRFLFIAG